MSTTISNRILQEIIDKIDIPDSAYEKAEKRYQDLGDWFNGPSSSCAKLDPHIYPQGSFRLGTVNRPLTDKEEYDLDLACKLRKGVSKQTHSQFDLKKLVGDDVESYRRARKIQEEKEEHHRCWRLHYADDLKFHMDVVPCIDGTRQERDFIKAAVLNEGTAAALSDTVANLAVDITDNGSPNYRNISNDWLVSNPDGYARWFESRMKLAARLLEERAFQVKAATIDDLPVFKWKTPLQRCVQILKRHRDVMFAEAPDGKPISIIITTLAAGAYRGERDIEEALSRILTDMGGLVRSATPRVPNPVNPVEDFADKWATPKGRTLRLEENFWAWLTQAKTDFGLISNSWDADFIAEQAMVKFGANLNAGELHEKLGIGMASVVTTPKTTKITETPAKPWRK